MPLIFSNSSSLFYSISLIGVTALSLLRSMIYLIASCRFVIGYL